MKILIIEDEKQLADTVESYLKMEGYLCEKVFDFDQAVEKIELYDYDCALVDINLPGGSGLELIRLLKKKKSITGIIIISARQSIDDRISGLEIGADDYLTKPFNLPELNARIKSIIRRIHFKGDNLIEFNELKIDSKTYQVWVKGEELVLTKKELDLLLFFLSNKNRVLTKESIGEHVWGDYADTLDSFDFIYTHIKNLRKKLLQHGSADYIRNVYGMGYKFVENP
jgi:DNA-binding response OmpR family regulator